MINTIIQWIKNIISDPNFQSVAENIALYLLVVSVSILLILLICAMIQIKEDIKQMDKNKRKRDKELLKFISKKKNKTY